MSIIAEHSDLTIQQVSRHTGLAESALRYYERIGLIGAVPRDESSGHRRYPPDLVAAIEALSCLRGSGMSVSERVFQPEASITTRRSDVVDSFPVRHTS